MKSKVIKSILAVSAVFMFGGCGVWADFTTYFNLYHNAKTIYVDAEDMIIKERKDLFAISEAAIPTGANASLPKVIEKLSKLLQFHNQSSFVDDALFMIGKAFFYQRSYIKASRKFQELIATQPNSDLVLDATLWLAKSEIQMKKFTEGLKYLEEAKQKATVEENREVLTEVYIEEVRYLKFSEKYTEAIQKLKDLITINLSDDISSKAQFEVGELYFEKMKEFSLAADAYKATLEFDPPFDIEYKSKLAYSICLRKMNKIEESQENLQKMSKELKFLEKLDEIMLQKGLNLKQLQKFDEAYKQFYTLDTLAVNSVSSGIARFEMGDMYENNLKNFDSAYVYYLKAEKSASPAEYVPRIKEKATLFKRYEGLQTNLYVYNRQLAYLADPIEFKRDSLKFYADSADAKLADLFSLPVELSDSAKRAIDSLKAVKDSLDNLAKIEPPEQFGEDEMVQGRPKQGDDPNAKGDGTNPNQPPVIQKKGWAPVMPVISADSLNSLLVKVYFDLGNVFYGEIIIPDSSYYYYTKMLKDYPQSKYTGQALFSLGNYYLDKNEKATADSIFQVVYENYKNESVVNLAADKLGKPKVVLNTAPADILYEEAEGIYFDKQYGEAVKKYWSVYKLYPETFTAPKSLLAAGFTLENDLNLVDSAFAVYDTLVTRYPQTRFTNKILPKVNFYKEEKARIKKAIDDSLKVISDSLKADSIARNTPKIDSTSINLPDSLKNLPGVLDQSPDSLKNIPGGIDQTSDSLKKIQESVDPFSDTKQNFPVPSDTINRPKKEELKEEIPPLTNFIKRRDLLDLIEEGESTTTEFKLKFTEPEKIAKVMISFANTKGGYLIFGVNDDKKVVGLESEKTEYEFIKETTNFYITPEIDFLVQFINIDQKELVVVFIPESFNKPHRIQDYKEDLDLNTAQVYIRVNDKSLPASKQMIRIMRAQSSSSPLVKYTIGDLEKKVFFYLESHETIDVNTLAKTANISGRRASRTLVTMVRAGALYIHTKDNGEEFFTVA